MSLLIVKTGFVYTAPMRRSHIKYGPDASIQKRTTSSSHQPEPAMMTLEIRFDEGLTVHLPVSAPLLLSMLEIRPGITGVTFCKNLRFAVVQENGQRAMMSSSHISFVGTLA